MAYFPVLKTGAGAQYGCERVQRRPVSVQRFLDGKTQRFAAERGVRAWRLRFEGLSAQEAEQVGRFVASHLETQERFTFRDPWNAIEFEGCEVAADGYRVRSEGEHKYEIEVLIEQRQV